MKVKKLKQWLAILLAVIFMMPSQPVIAAKTPPVENSELKGTPDSATGKEPEEEKEEESKETQDSAPNKKQEEESEEDIEELKGTPSEAQREKPKEEVIFNTGNYEVSVVGYEDFWDYEFGDAYFEEDGNYTINIPEENPFFPYEVQFTYNGKKTTKWFMTPDDSVQVDGHTFYVSAYFDGTVVTQMNLEVAGDTVVVYPEKKKFKNGSGAMTMSLLPLEERYLSVDLSDYTPVELTMVSVDSLFTGEDKLEDTDKVVWSFRGGDDYIINSSGDVVDLSYGTYSGKTTWEMIVGEADQLAGTNIRYYVGVNTQSTSSWLIPTIYKQDSEDNRINVEVSNASYRDYKNGDRYLSFNVPYDKVDYNAQVYLGLKINSSIFSNPKFASFKVFEGMFQSVSDAETGTDITDQIFNSEMNIKDLGYKMNVEDEAWLTMVTYDQDGNATGCLPFYLEMYRTSKSTVEDRISTSMVVKSEDGYDEIANRSKNNTIDDCHNITEILDTGYPADGLYYLTMRFYRNDTENSSLVTAAYVGQYTSIAEADKAGTENIKNDLFGEKSKAGYAADYSKGIYFTIFVGNDGTEGQKIFKYHVTTEEGRPSLSGDTLARFTGLMDKDGNLVESYVVDDDEDSYAENGYRTILVDETVDLTSLAPLFETRIGINLYTDDSGVPEVSGKSIHDFSNGPIQYTTSAENKENQKNYWLQVVKATEGDGWLYINSLEAEESGTEIDAGVTVSKREVYLDGLYDYVHDILLINMGKDKIPSLSAELVSNEVELDDYWTLKGRHELLGIDTAYGWNYNNLSNMAKIRIKAKDGVEAGENITGTLTIKSGNTALMVLTLTGIVGDPGIVTKEIPQAVKYVPYGTMVQNSNKYSWNRVSYSLRGGSLPAGMELKPNGEIYGVPTETGEFTFTVRLKNSANAFSDSERTFTLIVNENTDENVYAATDLGYNLTQTVQDIDLNSSESQTMVSQGIYAEFKDIFLDGVKLQEGVDYTSESGSTRITIRSQTLKASNTAGTHTLGIEFRTKDTNDLKRAAQNYKVAGSGQGNRNSSSGNGGSGKPAQTKDSRKGFMNSQSGIITGEGVNYSHWQQDEHGWKLIYADGTEARGSKTVLPDGTVVEQVVWELINGSMYAFGADGYLKSGWVYDYQSMNWYCVSVESGMKTGWYMDPQDGCFYFLDLETGQIVTGWKLIDGKWYYFNAVSTEPTYIFDEKTGSWLYNVNSKNKPLGSMYRDEKTPDGYTVGPDGTWDGKEQ